MTGIYIDLLVIFFFFIFIQAHEIPLNLPLISNVDISTYGYEQKFNFNYKDLHDSVANSVHIAGKSDDGGDRVMHRIQFTPRFRKVSWNFFIVLDPSEYEAPFETYGFLDTSVFIHVSPISFSDFLSSSSPVYDAIYLAQRLEAPVHFLFPDANNTWRNYVVPDIRSPTSQPTLSLLEIVPFKSHIMLKMARSLSFHGNKVGVEGQTQRSCSVEFRLKSCSEHFRFVATAERYFNFTTEYMSYWEINHYLTHGNHDSIHSFVSEESYVVQYRTRKSSASCFLRDAEDYFLLYCENELKYLRSSSTYWTSPLDTTVWVLLVLSLTFSAAIASTKPRKTFIIAFTELVGTLLRQISNRKMFFLQVVFCFMGFFVSIPYESVVTSDVTVPLPPLVVRDLKELVVDRGYKMLYPIMNISELAGYDLHEFSDGFKKYNLSDVFLSFQGFDYANDTKASCLAKKKNNLATDVGQSELGWIVMEFQSEAKERFCHVVPEPFFRRYFATLVRGRGHEKIVRFLSLTREVGILGFWYSNHHWFTEYRNKMYLLARQNVHPAEDKEVLRLNERIAEIFQAFAGGIGVSATCLIGEVVWYFMKTRGNTIVVIQ
jgi:hypothetical protein